MVVEGLDIGEDTHGVRLTAHDHHVVHLDEPVAARFLPGDTGRGGQYYNSAKTGPGVLGLGRTKYSNVSKELVQVKGESP